MNRREFLSKSSTIAGAGLVLGAPSVLGAAGSANDKINVALIGMGKQGRVLFEAMSNIPGIHFQAVCDIWDYNLNSGAGKVRALQKHMPNRYTDIDELLEKEKGLDVAIVATPDFWHSPHTVKCLDAGLHVYCEKMMSNTIDGARAMVHAMERNKKLCQIGHQRRSNPRYRYTLDHLINNNKICGTIVNINGQWNRAVSSSQDIQYKKSLAIDPARLKQYGFKDMHQFMNWRFYRDLSGGPISDLGAHQIDVFNWFLGCQPKSVFASGGNDFFKTREHFDNVMAIFEYDSAQGPVRAFYQVLTTTSSGGGFYESFMGTEGTIKTSEMASGSAIYRESSAPLWDDLVKRGYLRKKAAPAPAKKSDGIASYASAAPEEFAIPGVLNKQPHQNHLENFFAAVRGEAKLNCDARHAFESEAPIFWVNPSALQKEPIIFTPEQLQV
ncbi:Gfo/Idh/MocA family oxidoreductase [Verrucomicrobiaceae bacterium N1E253]|uniref:Gfo/Idh/MocA family oxidoreductase n=1 Tax=Oceaniferula marina TaxID=2748318 RepID=A0A851GER5_9BACT|nr:Gfo/Idh/MocA family oxidoreductase [Oceaniferula marina]NWK56248.1 Gfo/Idh/MocA family oxidoreductase [Oceaniferula marina]